MGNAIRINRRTVRPEITLEVREEETKPRLEKVPQPVEKQDTSPNGSAASSLSRRSDLDLRQSLMRQKIDASTNVGQSDDQKPSGATLGTGNFADRVKARFGDWDRDGNKYLSTDEIDKAMLDGSNTGDDAATLATLKKKVDTLQQLSDDEIGPENDGLSEKDLAAYQKDQDTERWYGTFQKKIGDSSKDLFANGQPDVNAIRQGSIGDCWFVSAVAAKTNADPDSIKKMITDNGNGTYTVQLPGKKPVTVDRPTEAEVAFYAGAGKDGLWMSVLEKAYGKTKAQSNVLWNSTIPQDELDGAKPTSSGINAISANGSDEDMLALTRMNTTRSKLDKAFRDKKVVTALVGRFSPTGDLPSSHIYSILGWDRATDTVTVRNPWGSTELRNKDGKPRDGTNDGVFKMSMKEFYEQFTTIGYEQ